MSHRVDVLIPAYNAEATLGVAIESILVQTVRDFEIHIVDDGSTDRTGAIADEFAARDPRVRVHHQVNGGIVDALNAGLMQCHAEFLGRIDADDLAYPDRFEKQLALLAEQPDVVAVGTAVRHIDIDGNPLGSIARIGSPDQADPEHIPCIEPYLIHPTLMARRAAIEAIGNYRHVCYAEDTDLYWRLRDVGRLVNMPELLGDYRFHDGSISGQSIVNGRIMSISSQLTAVSTLRRIRGVPDIEFRKDGLAVYRKAGTLEAMSNIAAEQLTPDERRHYELAVAAKLLELTSYRPYELETSDCMYIGQIARRGLGHLPEPNRGLLRRHISGTAARIAAAGRVDDARHMLPAMLYPGFTARMLARVALPDRMWRMIRQSGSDSMFK